MPQSKRRKGVAKGQVVVSQEKVDDLTARWEETRRNQITVINRLTGIIDFTRETVYSPSLTPDQKIQALKEKFNA